MPKATLLLGYDELYLVSAALSEVVDGCARRAQEARAASDAYKAAFEDQRTRKYRKLLELVHTSMAMCNRSSAAVPAIPLAQPPLNTLQEQKHRSTA